MDRVQEGGGKIQNSKRTVQSTGSSEVYTGGIDSKVKGPPRVNKCAGCSELIFENLTWLTSDEAVAYLRLPTVGALRVLVCRRKLPFHKLGRRLRFKKAELDGFLDASGKGII